MIVYVDCSQFMQELLADCDLPAAFRVHAGRPSAEQLADLLADATVAIDSNTHFEAEIFRRCPSSIVFLGSGAKNYVDLAAAAAAGVRVHTIKGYGDRSIAEHSFGLALAAARQFAAIVPCRDSHSSTKP
jgi:D-3-phosphoglycerate dehydrogenase